MCPKRVDHSVNIGRTFGRLQVIGYRTGGHDTIYQCRCECGSVVDLIYSNVRRGNTKSCGCWKVEHGYLTGKAHVRHGMSHTRTYRTWISIRRRCTLRTHKDYQWYGARGISVCDRWNSSFESFLADMGEAPEGMSIDRINNNGDYEPGNCKWSTATEQNQNRRPSSEWARHG